MSLKNIYRSKYIVNRCHNKAIPRVSGKSPAVRTVHGEGDKAKFSYAFHLVFVYYNKGLPLLRIVLHLKTKSEPVADLFNFFFNLRI